MDLRTDILNAGAHRGTIKQKVRATYFTTQEEIEAREEFSQKLAQSASGSQSLGMNPLDDGG